MDIRNFSNAKTGGLDKASRARAHEMQVKQARDNALSAIEKITICGAVTKNLYAEALAAGEPIPDSGIVRYAQGVALTRAIDAKVQS